jgi:hypothetical protein
MSGKEGDKYFSGSFVSSDLLEANNLLFIHLASGSVSTCTIQAAKDRGTEIGVMKQVGDVEPLPQVQLPQTAAAVPLPLPLHAAKALLRQNPFARF